MYYLGAKAVFQGPISDCLPSAEGTSTILTIKGNILEGVALDAGTLDGQITLENQTVIKGVFRGFQLNGTYEFNYPDGRVCNQTWISGSPDGEDIDCN